MKILIVLVVFASGLAFANSSPETPMCSWEQMECPSGYKCMFQWSAGPFPCEKIENPWQTEDRPRPTATPLCLPPEVIPRF